MRLSPPPVTSRAKTCPIPSNTKYLNIEPGECSNTPRLRPTSLRRTVDTTTVPDARLPDHELIRRDAAAHPERSYREHVEASRAILGAEYIETLRRIQAREGATRGDR